MAAYQQKLWILFTFLHVCFGLISDEVKAAEFLVELDKKQSVIKNNSTKIYWSFITNMTEYNQKRVLADEQYLKSWKVEVAENASMFDFNNFSNNTLKRVFKKLSDKGGAALSVDEYEQLNKLSLEKLTIYNSAKLCRPGSNEAYSFDPELTLMLRNSKDYDELLWIWKNWRDHTGKKMKEIYLEHLDLSNKAARLNGWSDAGEAWRQGYDPEEEYDFVSDVERLYQELKPLYAELHTYVKHQLKNFYGADKFPSTGHIPAHILGEMWAGTWNHIGNIVQPYKDIKAANATPAIQNLTIREMYEMADEFFVSLGLLPATQEFWDRSMLEKPKDGRPVGCHASAWDFSDGKDFRIRQCTKKNMDDFITVHHEMGHIQYFMQYKDLLVMFRDGANPGFHEAVGDILTLSVSTPKHLQTVGLIDSYATGTKADINFLLNVALIRVAFLPWGKLMDDYRWSLFAGNITDKEMNAAWWSKRCSYQGISPPVKRSEEDFDPGSKFHIAIDVPYVRYFVAFILEFQFHEALCKAANHTGPLHTCDIYQSKEAGAKFRDVMKLGSSRSWKDALEIVTGSRELSASPLLNYFEPLRKWLEGYNSQLDQSDREWTDDCPEDLPDGDDIPTAVCNDNTTSTSPSPASHVLNQIIFVTVSIYSCVSGW